MVAEKRSVWRFLGTDGDDLSHIVDKTHIEHAVGLIEDKHLDMRKVDAAALHVVEETAGSSYDDIDAAAKRAKLVVDTDTAVNGQRAKVHETAVVDDAFFDLEGKLASRCKNERFDNPLFGRLLVAEPVEDRQHKGGRLARAGLGAADKVFAFDGGRDRLRLNFGRDGVAGGKNTLHQAVGKTK